MIFDPPLVPARLLRRYKRFLADVELRDGAQVTAHCANPGAMTGLAEPGMRVWLAPNTNPKAKLDWRWELVETPTGLVGINTHRANAIVEDAIRAGHIPELAGFTAIRREVPYGAGSRVDFVLDQASGAPCYLEVKMVTLRQNGIALFPDAVTARGARHLRELSEIVTAGGRALLYYHVSRSDCYATGLAEKIDPVYASTFRAALAAGVEVLAYASQVTAEGISPHERLPLI